MTTHQVAGIN